MLFTVVTPSLNCRDYILKNIESVRRQGFGPDQLEHRVVDGGSSDGTLEILKQQKDLSWTSEPDKGLSDAVNKGIKSARGSWIVWLNADDFLEDNALNVFLNYARQNPQIRVFSGGVAILRYDGSLEQIFPGWDYNLKDLLGLRTGINQASTIVHREVYQNVGLLDVSDRYTMDYEWVIRAMHQYQCMPIPHVLTSYQRRKGSITDAHLVKQYVRFLELRRQYGRPRLCRAEFRIRFFIYTQWLRQIHWVRRVVREIKGMFGCKPLHPMH